MTVVDVNSHAGATRVGVISLTFHADTPGTPADWFAGNAWSPGWHSYRDEDAETTPWRDNVWPSYQHDAGTVGGHGAIPLESWNVPGALLASSGGLVRAADVVACPPRPHSPPTPARVLHGMRARFAGEP